MDWDKVQGKWKQDAIDTDKEDLIGLLSLRFGHIPDDVKETIENISDGNSLERLILVAANVPSWDTFIAELKESDAAFRIVGSKYQPF